MNKVTTNANAKSTMSDHPFESITSKATQQILKTEEKQIVTPARRSVTKKEIAIKIKRSSRFDLVEETSLEY